jgi:hypothetical protein
VRNPLFRVMEIQRIYEVTATPNEMSEPPSGAIRQERWEGANLSEKSSNKRI